jgi:RNA polymerase sigma-70 factor (ECF subfamily)
MPEGPSSPTIALPSFQPAAGAIGIGAEPQLEDEVIGLFDEFRNRLLRYLLSFGVPVAEGEEIIQEVFLALVWHVRLGKSRRNLRGWIFRVAHNLALKRLQRARRFQNGIAAGRICANPGYDRPDPFPNPEEQLLNSQRQARLMVVFRALPRRDQSCLSLRAEGLRYREIAEVLDMSLGAVSISLARSFKRLEGADAR